jgi:hypothetical protein
LSAIRRRRILTTIVVILSASKSEKPVTSRPDPVAGPGCNGNGTADLNPGIICDLAEGNAFVESYGKAKKTFADADHLAQLAGTPVYPVHLLYAVLLHEDEAILATFGSIGIESKRLEEVARREVMLQQDDVGGTKTRWN